MNPRPIFSNSQFTEWLEKEWCCYLDNAYLNLRDDLKKRDAEEADEVLTWAAVTKMTSQARIELAHHNEKVRKMCGFGNCKYEPSCLRDLK